MSDNRFDSRNFCVNHEQLRVTQIGMFRNSNACKRLPIETSGIGAAAGWSNLFNRDVDCVRFQYALAHLRSVMSRVSVVCLRCFVSRYSARTGIVDWPTEGTGIACELFGGTGISGGCLIYKYCVIIICATN